MVFFIFKQKTAYEMRISDWSSDVCSSDLSSGSAPRSSKLSGSRASVTALPRERGSAHERAIHLSHREARSRDVGDPDEAGARDALPSRRDHRRCRTRRGQPGCRCMDRAETRSEEHTSELQSLMRISYAVFCLTKKYNIQYGRRIEETGRKEQI